MTYISTHTWPIGICTGDMAVGVVEVNKVGSLAIAVAMKEVRRVVWVKELCFITITDPAVLAYVINPA